MPRSAAVAVSFLEASLIAALTAFTPFPIALESKSIELSAGAVLVPPPLELDPPDPPLAPSTFFAFI
jgi:hypothetical protein